MMRASGFHIIVIISSFLLGVTTHTSRASALDTLPKHCHFSSKFDQEKRLKSLPVPLKSSGRMYFSCQAGLIWQTQMPIQESLILTNSDYHFKQLNESNSLNRKSTTTIEVLDSVEIRFLSRLLIGLMSADKDYIINNFTVKETTARSFELTPSDTFISKAINTVNIRRPEDKDSLNIIIDQKDGTLINIQSHSAIILESSEHSATCLKNNYEEQLCFALFKPLDFATQLVENTGN